MSKQFDLENERAIVVACLKDPEARKKAVGAVSPEDFLGQRYRTIFEAVAECEKRSLTPDKAVIASLSDSDYGGLEFLDMLFGMEPALNVGFHLERLRKDSSRAAAKSCIEELDRMLSDRTVSHEECVKQAAEMNSTLRVTSSRRDRLAEKYLTDFDRRCTEGSMFVSTGYGSLDSVLVEGFSKGTVSIIAGRTGHGKTSFVCDMVRRMLAGRKKPKILVVANEIGRVRFIDKLSSSATLIKTEMFRKTPHELTLEERDEIRRVAKKLVGEDELLTVLDNPFFDLAEKAGRWGNEEALDKMEELIAEGGYEVVFWDLWLRGLLDTSPGAVEVGMVRMQQMSARYATHNGIVHQIGRKAEERKVKERRPRMTDLKGSGGLEEVPDLGLLLYRPKVYKPFMRDDVIEVGVGKQRDGAIGRTMLADFYPQICRLEKDRLADVKEDDSERAEFKPDEETF